MAERKLQEAPDNQNLSLGVVGGIAAAVVGAVIWAVITVLTGYQIGWMAVGVGFLVGYAVRLLGKGVDPVFGYAGAAIALAGCLAGNLLTVVIMAARQEQGEHDPAVAAHAGHRRGYHEGYVSTHGRAVLRTGRL